MNVVRPRCLRAEQEVRGRCRNPRPWTRQWQRQWKSLASADGQNVAINALMVDGNPWFRGNDISAQFTDVFSAMFDGRNQCLFGGLPK